MKKPSIPVTEVSNKIVNLKKWYLSRFQKGIYGAVETTAAINALRRVRIVLELRSRARRERKQK